LALALNCRAGQVGHLRSAIRSKLELRKGQSDGGLIHNRSVNFTCRLGCKPPSADQFSVEHHRIARRTSAKPLAIVPQEITTCVTPMRGEVVGALQEKRVVKDSPSVWVKIPPVNPNPFPWRHGCVACRLSLLAFFRECGKFFRRGRQSRLSLATVGEECFEFEVILRRQPLSQKPKSRDGLGHAFFEQRQG